MNQLIIADITWPNGAKSKLFAHTQGAPLAGCTQLWEAGFTWRGAMPLSQVLKALGGGK